MPQPASPLKPATANAANKNLTSIAFERLRGDILRGNLRPNERLRITSLSERYDIGATAIREALSRLVTDGMVMSEDQRGFRVSSVSRDDILDLTQTRVEVEGLALSKALALGDVDWESNVLSAYHRLSKCPQPEPGNQEHYAACYEIWIDLHRDFHHTLIAGCKSPWLIKLCGILYDRAEFYRNLSAQHDMSGARDVNAEHRHLMETALARDAQAATTALSAHIWHTTNIILKNEFAGDGAQQHDKGS